MTGSSRPVGTSLTVVETHHHTHQLAPSQRHQHARSRDRPCTITGRQVVEQLRQGNRQSDLDDAGVAHSAEFYQ